MDQKMYVIYNCCYGGFGFSNNFRNELSKRLNQPIENADEDYRMNQTACELLLEKGSKWSSGMYSALDVIQIPVFMKEYIKIDDYDGCESVEILYNKAIANKTREIMKNPTPESIKELQDFIKMIDTF